MSTFWHNFVRVLESKRFAISKKPTWIFFVHFSKMETLLMKGSGASVFSAPVVEYEQNFFFSNVKTVFIQRY